MSTPATAQGIRFREFRWEDLPAFVEIRNRSFPDMPQTLESAEHFEHTYPPDNPRRRAMALPRPSRRRFRTTANRPGD